MRLNLKTRKLLVLAMSLVLVFSMSLQSVWATGVETKAEAEESEAVSTPEEEEGENLEAADKTESQEVEKAPAEEESSEAVEAVEEEVEEAETEATVEESDDSEATSEEKVEDATVEEKSKEEAIEETQTEATKEEKTAVASKIVTYGNPVPYNLPIDGITINDFKVIDKNQGDLEIDISYAMETDPSKFTNILNANQKDSNVRLKLKFDYKSPKPITIGDVLTIPSVTGTGYPTSPLPFKDANGNVLGTWKYTGGAFVIEFKGDYVKDHIITDINNAELVTSWSKVSLGNQPKTFNKGERYVRNGIIGNKEFTIAFEKYYIVAEHIDETDKQIRKSATSVTDSQVLWYYAINNDYKRKTIDGGTKYFDVPYLVNNGTYKPDSFTGIYIEDTIKDANSVTVNNGFMGISGITDDGKIISGHQGISLKFDDVLTKVDQAGRSRAEVKAALNDGEYCMYQNDDGSTTVMIKYWDMNDSSGFKYSDVPQIKAAGGVGSYLKATVPSIYGNVSDATIQKMNQLYDGKIVQNISLVINAQYDPVAVPTKKENVAQITTDQTGILQDSAMTATMTPPSGLSDAPADPLSIKLIKVDVDKGTALSEGFKFELQKSTDNGATWITDTLDASMIVKGTLNADNTVSPIESGILVVQKLEGIQLYRFVEKAHGEGYLDTTVDDANPNDKDNFTSANSTAVEVNNQNTEGHTIIMYNKKPAPALDVKKVADKLEYVVGETATYTIEVKNSGNEDLTDVVVKDAKVGLDETIAALAVGEKETFTVTKVFTEADKGDYENTATAEGVDQYGNKGKGEGVSVVKVKEAPAPELTVEKTADKAEYAIGETATYTIKVTNSGNVDLVDVAVKDAKVGLDETIPALAVGASESFTATKTFTDAEVGNFENIASAEGKDADGNAAEKVEDSVTVEVKELPGDAPKKEVFKGNNATNIDGEEVMPGDELTYVITYKNTTGVVKEVTITDEVPANTEFLAANNGGTEAGGTVTWTKSVKNDEEFKVTMNVKVADNANGVEIKNVANVKAGDDEVKTNETKNTVPSFGPALAVEKTADKAKYLVGETATYTIKVTNSGDVDLVDVAVKDAKVGLDETIPALAVGESKEFTATKTFTDADAGDFTNTATAEGKDKYGNEAEKAEGSVTVKVEKEVGSIKVEKTADKAEYTVGETAVYTIKVINTGNVKIASGVVKDEKLNFEEKVENLEPGKTFVVKVKRVFSAKDVGEFVNTAKAELMDANGNPLTGEGEVKVKVKEKEKESLPETGSTTGMTGVYATLFILAGLVLTSWGRKKRSNYTE
ncbi:MAG: hypothetical protein CSB16_00875 [Clostridiales bacterium]|nr:MAG: hypothetical protein CSB16_00875 [Clostridiales bacterium]